MTFNTYETSIDQGSPVLLYDFYIGLSHWRYTSADRPITYLSNEYDPLAIASGSINQGNEIKKKTLAITVPLTAPIVSLLQTYPPSGDVMLNIVAIHTTDPDLQGFTVFIGRIVSQSQAGATVTINAEPAYTGVKTTGLRRRWQLNCAHVLYGATTCTLRPTDFSVSTTITTVAGAVITCSGLASPVTGLTFAGGYIEWDSGLGYNERRSINSVASDVLTLNYGSPDLIAGLGITAYLGCNHTTDNCTKFVPPAGDPVRGNMDNYGGQPYIPSVNPLTGNPIY